MSDATPTTLAYDPPSLAERFLAPCERVILAGATGTGKSMLAARMADAFAGNHERTVELLDADPGTPVVGPPGAVSAARRQSGDWQCIGLAGLATLDAGRFRAPLVTAAHRLLADLNGPLLVDSPGLHRGVPATELLSALAGVSEARAAIILGTPEEHRELYDAFRSAGCSTAFVRPAGEATRASAAKRAAERTEAWDAYLRDAASTTSTLAGLGFVGAHPPLDVRDAWPRRQIALLDDRGDTIALGEVVSFEPSGLVYRAPEVDPQDVETVVARDARRNAKGRLRTETSAPPSASTAELEVETPFTLRESPNERIGLGSPLTARAGLFRAILVGGFFDDPTILVEAVQASRAMLFDLGEVERLPVPVLNKVTDVFVTHAHTDHFAGFVTLLRSRVHFSRTCRLFGPPGIADRVESLVRGFTWDRLGEGEGPVFEVGELHGEELMRWEIRAEKAGRKQLDTRAAPGGRILHEPRYDVRACELDHGIPVLAFTIEEHENYSVRSDRLEPPYEPGPWLGELKREFAQKHLDHSITLPDGSRESVSELAAHLLMVGEGEKLTYASDLADTETNRQRLVSLARGSDIFICEAFYSAKDADKGDEFGHLTAPACAEIARDAGVGRLIPFHFSARYDDEPEVLYREILDIFQDVEVPELVARRLG